MRTGIVAAGMLVVGLVLGVLLNGMLIKRQATREFVAHRSVFARFHPPKEAPPQFGDFILGMKSATAPNNLPTDCGTDHNAWTQWRDQQIATMLEPTYVYQSGKLIDRDHVIATAGSAFTRLDGCMQAEPQFFDSSTDFGKSFVHFYGFVRAMHWMALKGGSGFPTNQEGFTISDKDYWELAKPYLTFPDLIADRKFLSAMSTPAGYSAAAKMIADANATLTPDKAWPVAFFKARFITTIDLDVATYGRMLIVVPKAPGPNGGEIDRWILFGILTPEMDQTMRTPNVSQFAVYTAPNGHQTTYMSDFTRQPNDSGGIDLIPTIKRAAGHDPSKNCYDCHKLPILPIYPDTEYKFDGSGKLIPKQAGDVKVADQVNHQFVENYGPPDFAAMDLHSCGPPLGQVGRPQRTDDFIKSCANDASLAPDSIRKIKSAMNCAGCHSEDGYGSINYLQAVHNKRDVTAFRDKESMINTYVKNGWMPPDKTLSAPERNALAACVVKEYYDQDTQTGIFEEWLKGMGPQ